MRVRRLTVVNGGWLGVTSEDVANCLIGAVVEYLRGGEANMAMIYSPPLDEPIGIATVRHTPRAFRNPAFSASLHRLLDVRPGQTSFLNGLSGNERYQQRKRIKKLQAEFGRDVSIKRFQSASEVSELIECAETIARSSYQRGLGVGFEATPFVRHRLAFEASKGWMRGYVLTLGGRSAAFWIGSLRNNVFLSDYLSFDPVFSPFSPGLYLVMKVIDDLYSDVSPERVRLVDFGIGDATYKDRLANRARRESDLYVFEPSIKGRAIGTLHATSLLLGGWSKQLLATTGALDAFRRKWRARHRKSNP